MDSGLTAELIAEVKALRLEIVALREQIAELLPPYILPQSFPQFVEEDADGVAWFYSGVNGTGPALVPGYRE